MPALLDGVPVLVAAGLGAGVGLGLWLIVNGIARPASPPKQRWGTPVTGRGSGSTPPTSTPVGLLVRCASAVAAAAMVGLATRWPVAGLAAGVGAWLSPAALTGPGSARARRRRLEQLEALATWTESLAATLAAAAGLEQAIIASTRQPPDALAAPLRGLGDAVASGARLPEALRAFSRDVDNPSTDAVVAALLLAATRGGSNLREPLAQLASATRQEVTARQAVETGRAQLATDSRLIVGISLAAVGGLVVFNRGFLTPYDTPGGQVVLALVLAMAVAAFVWMRRLSAVEDPPRIVDLSTAGRGRP